MIGEEIIKIRKKLCISQQEFAKLIGITRSSISCYEKNRRTPNFQILRLIKTFAEENGINFFIEDYIYDRRRSSAPRKENYETTE